MTTNTEGSGRHCNSWRGFRACGVNAKRFATASAMPSGSVVLAVALLFGVPQPKAISESIAITTNSEVELMQTTAGVTADSLSLEPSRPSDAVAARIAQLQQLTKSQSAVEVFSGWIGLSQIARSAYAVGDAQAAVQALVQIFDCRGWQRHGYPYMDQVTADRFPSEAKEYVCTKLHGTDPRGEWYRELVLVAGIADMKEDIPFLKPLISDFPLDDHGRLYYGSVQWAAALACARMGDDEATSLCVKTVREQADKDYVAERLLGSLAYMRQPEAVALISEYLFSDSYSRPKGPDQLGVGYAYMAIEALRGTIKGFPARMRSPYGQAEDTKVCRKWMSEQERLEFIR